MSLHFRTTLLPPFSLLEATSANLCHTQATSSPTFYPNLYNIYTHKFPPLIFHPSSMPPPLLFQHSTQPKQHSCCQASPLVVALSDNLPDAVFPTFSTTILSVSASTPSRIVFPSTSLPTHPFASSTSGKILCSVAGRVYVRERLQGRRVSWERDSLCEMKKLSMMFESC